MKNLFVLAAIAGLAFITGSALLQPPPLASSRRPLTTVEVLRVRETAPGTAEWRLRFLERVGVSSRMNANQLEYFRARGTDETFLLRYLAEYGITPEESQALEAEGVQMALSNPLQMDGFHWAALAEVVVLGEVEEIRGNPAGPYHTEVELRVERHLKAEPGRRPDLVTGVLLRTGPRAHAGAGDVHHVEAMEEPNLKEGERVVLFLSRRPLNLISLFGSTLANTNGELPESFEREYGSLGELVRVLDAPIQLEVVRAYKVVGDTAVLKNRAYRIAGSDDVIPLAQLTSRIERIAAAQERARQSGAGR